MSGMFFSLFDLDSHSHLSIHGKLVNQNVRLLPIPLLFWSRPKYQLYWKMGLGGCNILPVPCTVTNTSTQLSEIRCDAPYSLTLPSGRVSVWRDHSQLGLGVMGDCSAIWDYAYVLHPLILLTYLHHLQLDRILFLRDNRSASLT